MAWSFCTGLLEEVAYLMDLISGGFVCCGKRPIWRLAVEKQLYFRRSFVMDIRALRLGLFTAGWKLYGMSRSGRWIGER